MDANELRALADALEPMAKAPRFEDFDVPGFCAWVRACADAEPAVAWMALAYGLPSQATTDEPTAIRWQKAGGDVVPLYTHPAPQLSDTGFTLDQLAEACMWAEIPDSKYESLCIALAEERKAMPQPQAEPKREPLWDHEISKLAWEQNVWGDGMITFSFLSFARAIERAHGIGGSDAE